MKNCARLLPDARAGKTKRARDVASLAPFLFVVKKLHNPVLEQLTRLKARDAAGLDLNLRSSLRITASTSLALRDIERAETGQRDLVPLAQALSDVVRDGVQRILRQRLRDLAVLRQRVD